MAKLIAIDFGTTKTSVAVRVLQNGSDPEIVDFGGGRRSPIETVLRFNPNGDAVEEWGGEAWDHCVQYPDRTFFEFKPEIGSSTEFLVAGTPRSASYLSIEFLAQLRIAMEKMYNGSPFSPDQYTTWIGHPAEWNEAQKNELLTCAKKAGWPNVDLCDEATATAFYFADRGDLPEGEASTFLIFDFGGGTLDVCVMEVDENRTPKLCAVGGDSRIGGRRFDQCLIDHFLKEILEKSEATSLQPADEAEIRRCCRKLKEKLSDRITMTGKDSAEYTIPRLRVLDNDEYTLTLSRALFEEITESLRDGCRKVIDDVIKKSGLELDKIDKVLIAGGSSYFYFVRDLIKESLSEIEDRHIVRTAQPGEVVCKGLGLYPLPKKKRKPLGVPDEFPPPSDEPKPLRERAKRKLIGAICGLVFAFIIGMGVTLGLKPADPTPPVANPQNSKSLSIKCPTCNGSGNVICSHCGGDGGYGWPGNSAGIIPCKKCKSGKVRCSSCRGKGEIVVKQ